MLTYYFGINCPYPHECQVPPRPRGHSYRHRRDPVEDVSGDFVLLDGGEEGIIRLQTVRGKVRVIERDRQLA